MTHFVVIAFVDQETRRGSRLDTATYVNNRFSQSIAVSWRTKGFTDLGCIPQYLAVRLQLVSHDRYDD